MPRRHGACGGSAWLISLRAVIVDRVRVSKPKQGGGGLEELAVVLRGLQGSRAA